MLPICGPTQCGHGRSLAAGAPWRVPARAGARADGGPDGPGSRDPRQPRRGMVDATADPVREGAAVREIRALLRRGPSTHAGAPGGDHRRRAHLARSRVGLADPARARPRGEGHLPNREIAACAGCSKPRRASRRGCWWCTTTCCGAISRTAWASRAGARRSVASWRWAPRSCCAGTTTRRERSCSGAGWSSRRRGPCVGARAADGRRAFNFVTIEATAVHITFFRWDVESRRFRASDTCAFARAGKGAVPFPPARAGGHDITQLRQLWHPSSRASTSTMSTAYSPRRSAPCATRCAHGSTTTSSHHRRALHRRALPQAARPPDGRARPVRRQPAGGIRLRRAE